MVKSQWPPSVISIIKLYVWKPESQIKVLSQFLAILFFIKTIIWVSPTSNKNVG